MAELHTVRFGVLCFYIFGSATLSFELYFSFFVYHQVLSASTTFFIHRNTFFLFLERKKTMRNSHRLFAVIEFTLELLFSAFLLLALFQITNNVIYIICVRYARIFLLKVYQCLFCHSLIVTILFIAAVAIFFFINVTDDEPPFRQTQIFNI